MFDSEDNFEKRPHKHEWVGGNLDGVVRCRVCEIANWGEHRKIQGELVGAPAFHGKSYFQRRAKEMLAMSGSDSSTSNEGAKEELVGGLGAVFLLRMNALELAVPELVDALRELTPYVRHGLHKNAKTGCGGTWKKGGGCDCGATQAIEHARWVLEAYDEAKTKLP